jgi:2-aminoethylphosphonate-pyruvate transaminase
MLRRASSSANRCFSTKPKLLFTPGPLTTSQSVRNEMPYDYGSRDSVFMDCVSTVRSGLAGLCEGDVTEASGAADSNRFSTILLPGSGTNSVESVITSSVPRGGRLLILVNGVYGERMAKIATVAGMCVFGLMPP